MNYNEAIKGHYQGLNSANTLRNSVKLGRNLDSNFDRFKQELKGGQYSNSHYYPTNTFTKGIRLTNPKSKEDRPPIGRPLWQMELSKVVPAPTNYDVKREFDQTGLLKNPAKCLFGKGHNSYSTVSTRLSLIII